MATPRVPRLYGADRTAATERTNETVSVDRAERSGTVEPEQPTPEAAEKRRWRK